MTMENSGNRGFDRAERNDRGDRGERGDRGDGRTGFKSGFSRRRNCRFCSDKNLKLDYKEIETLIHFITERGKILPRRISGNCAKHQRWTATEIKRARQLAMLPYVGSIFEKY
jgi:small subunit ribosomal protein S18